MRMVVGVSAALLALSASLSFAAEPAMVMDSSMGKIYSGLEGHDALHLRQGRDGQIQLL